jgi:hypothetical protein
MSRLLIISLACLILAGMANGVMDTLQFHYAGSPFERMSEQAQRYWNPRISWENKYARNEEGKLLQPTRPSFPGSTTVFSFLTDGWHLMKFLYQGLLRLAIVLAACAALRTWILRVPWWAALIAWIALAAIQAAGFHITYTIIF